MVGGGVVLPITHIATTLSSLSFNLDLNDVLVCPDIKKDLLSVSKLTSDYSCSFTFDSTEVYVKDLLSSQTLAMGRKHNGLYTLHQPHHCALFSFRQQEASEEIWHR
ncbi:hypothetical protein Patl1_21114 [Pistacia atlantica]|uniref:Uncharacterized protein n=1 Tax=Pistacia atlantica TaxID=434234 RepID=A0ACC1BNS2_9ROSI|nr:hypothetical protein Patl1_21114 [Pistacia atlantica]